MKLEDQVVSLPLAKRLKELGVKQDGYFFWETFHAARGLRATLRMTTEFSEEHCSTFSAFTVAELGEMLPTWVTKPDGSKYRLSIWREDNDLWRTWYGHFEEERTEANSRAKMLIFLIENKLMDPAGGTPNA